MRLTLQTMFIGIFLLFVCSVQGQDPQFSQFYNSSLYYNPATAGMTQDLRFLSSYRNLWANVPGDLSTYFVSMDYQWTEKNVGLGFLMMGDNEGFSNLRTQRFELIYSYRIQSEDKMLQLGMSAFSLNIRNFNTENLVFTDQLDPIYGIVQESSFMHDDIETKVYPDWNVGMVYRQNFKNRLITPTIGLSASHIFRPRISVLNNDARLPVKYVLHANVMTQVVFNGQDPMKRKFAFLSPGFVYEYQKPFQTFSIGSGFDLFPLRFGLWFRNRRMIPEAHSYNSVVFMAGTIIPLSLNHHLFIDYSFDSTISSLEFASGGAHEITLIYNIALPERKGQKVCYDEWWRARKGIIHYPKSMKKQVKKSPRNAPSR